MTSTQMNETIDHRILYEIISSLVTTPDDVQVERLIDEKGVLLTVKVNAKDMGLVIGRQGNTANSIKTVLRAIGKAHEMNIRVEFLEPDGSTRVNSNNGYSYNGGSEDVNDDLQEFAIN